MPDIYVQFLSPTRKKKRRIIDTCCMLSMDATTNYVHTKKLVCVFSYIHTTYILFQMIGTR